MAQEALGHSQQPVDDRGRSQIPTVLPEKGYKGKAATAAGIAAVGVLAYLYGRGNGGDPNSQVTVPKHTPTQEVPGLVIKASPTPLDMPTIVYTPSPTETPTEEPINEEGRYYSPSYNYSLIPPENWFPNRGTNSAGNPVDYFVEPDRGATISIVSLENPEDAPLETFREIYKTQLARMISYEREPKDNNAEGEPLEISGEETFNLTVGVTEDEIFITYVGFLKNDKFWLIAFDNPKNDPTLTGLAYEDFITSIQTIHIHNN